MLGAILRWTRHGFWTRRACVAPPLHFPKRASWSGEFALAVFRSSVATLILACLVFPTNVHGLPFFARNFADGTEIDRAAGTFPNSAQLQRLRLGVALSESDRAEALDATRRLARMGAGLSKIARAKIVGLLGERALADLAPTFDQNTTTIARSARYSTIPAQFRIIEGLAWDSASHQLYATSVLERQLLLINPPFGARPMLGANAGGLYGAAFDHARRMLWAASSSAIGTNETASRADGLIGFNPRDGTVKFVTPPTGVHPTLGDMTVDSEGTLFATDSRDGKIWQCRPGCKVLSAYLKSQTLYSPQGIVAQTGSKFIYAADYRYGLVAIERQSRKILAVRGGPSMMLDGIDGLALYRGDLIAIQNGTLPVRILRLKLSASGLRILKLTVLERANPVWGEPTLGTVVGDKFLYVSDGQWESYDKNIGAGPTRPTPIRSLALR